MTIEAFCGNMRSGQRKVRIVVVKTVVICFTCRVTFETGRVTVDITTHVVMLIIHISLVMVMADDTTV
jgi:hypothetical protein